MLSLSNLLSGRTHGNEKLRYGHRRDRAESPAPRPVVVWAVTGACNLKCVHCYASAGDCPADNELSTAEGRALLHDLASYRVPAVLFSGGEPLVRPDFFELLEYARQLGLRCTLSTNGTRIDDETARDLAGLGLRYVGISLDGAQPRHDRLRGVEGAFEQTIEGIRACRRAGLNVGLRFTVHALNEPDLEEIFQICLDEGVSRLCIYHLAYAGRGRGMSRVDLSAEKTREVVERIISQTLRMDLTSQPLEVLTVGNHADAGYVLTHLERHEPDLTANAWDLLKGTGGNQSGNYIASIDPQGEVHYDQFSWHYACGNVRDRRFSTIWSRPDDERLKLLRDRQESLPERCRSCRFLPVCNGNLRTRAESAGGDWLGLDPACYLRDDEIFSPAAALG
jgi:radical SAM protein with 4Fe4S-binding SPASM domain